MVRVLWSSLCDQVIVYFYRRTRHDWVFIRAVPAISCVDPGPNDDINPRLWRKETWRMPQKRSSGPMSSEGHFTGSRPRYLPTADILV